MNKLDKSFYGALRFLANNSRAEIKVMDEQKSTDYDDAVPKEVETTLKQFGYVDLKGNSKYIITQSGLQQLRDLEMIRHRDLTIYISVVALIIAVISFAFSQGWIQ